MGIRNVSQKDVLSPDILSLTTYCPSGCFVSRTFFFHPEDFLSGHFVPGCFVYGRFAPDVFNE
jgi:hypothetical protein